MKWQQHSELPVASVAGVGLGWLAAVMVVSGVAAETADATGPSRVSTNSPAGQAADSGGSFPYPEVKLKEVKRQQDKSSYTLFNPTPDEGMRELTADRPDKTDCPYTVDAGHFQVEMDYANYTWDAPIGQPDMKAQGYQLAPMNLKVGVLNNLDFQLVLSPWQSLRTEDKNTGTVERESGFGDVIPRAKLNLIGNDSGPFALALIPFMKIPTAQHTLGNAGWEGGVGIPYAFDVPDWSLGFQTTLSLRHDEPGDGYHAEIANSVTVGHAVIGNLEYFVEFFSSASTEPSSDWVGTFDTWFTYKVNKDLALDAGVYLGLTEAAENWHLWVGMTKRF
jgi:hypothetical protein